MTPDVKKKLGVSFAVILGSFVIAGATLYFVAGNIYALSAKIVADRALVDKETGAVGVYASLKQQAAQAMTYQTAMDNLLPTQEGLIGFSQWVSGIASRYQVSANASFQGNGPPVMTASGAGQAPFSLSASGSLDNLTAFTTDLQSNASGFLLTLTSFTLAEKNGTYDLNSQGIVFFR